MLSVAFVFLLMTACENAPIEFDDFGKTVCYFPYQSPARTIILGKYDEGFNDNDNLHQFEIGVTMTGVYANKVDRKVYFELDTTLLSTVANSKYLPLNQFSIVTTSPVTIPAGDIKGRIMVKLTDEFFKDPKNVSSFYVATGVVCNYSVPLKITKVEGLDSILVGKSTLRTKDGLRDSIGSRVKSTDWKIAPKDYTLFGVKYINKYHGYYLRRGADKLTNTLTNVVAGTKIYRTTYTEGNEVVKVQTVNLDTVAIPSIIRRYNLPDGGALNLKVVFAADNTCKVINTATKVEIGTGMMKENADVWGGKTHDVIYLDYSYIDVPRNEKHEVKDTMVIRDRGVGFELLIPTLKP